MKVEEAPMGLGGPGTPLLTLEPLIEVLRSSLEAAEWQLSGVQKTTSHEYDGRWAGESTRSAYLFFHSATDEGDESIDVFVDETSQGLNGSLTLVMDGPRLKELGSVQNALDRLRAAAATAAPAGVVTSIALRAGLRNADEPGGNAETVVRFRIPIPLVATRGGARDVAAVARSAVTTFEVLRVDPNLARLSFGT
jgi:hypothetical protein